MMNTDKKIVKIFDEKQERTNGSGCDGKGGCNGSSYCGDDSTTVAIDLHSIAVVPDNDGDDLTAA